MHLLARDEHMTYEEEEEEEERWVVIAELRRCVRVRARESRGRVRPRVVRALVAGEGRGVRGRGVQSATVWATGGEGERGNIGVRGAMVLRAPLRADGARGLRPSAISCASVREVPWSRGARPSLSPLEASCTQSARVIGRSETRDATRRSRSRRRCPARVPRRRPPSNSILRCARGEGRATATHQI